MEEAEECHLPRRGSRMQLLILVLEMFSILYFSKKTEIVEFRSQIKVSAFRCHYVGVYKQSFPKADGVVVNIVSRTPSIVDQKPTLGSRRSLPRVT